MSTTTETPDQSARPAVAAPGAETVQPNATAPSPETAAPPPETAPSPETARSPETAPPIAAGLPAKPKRADARRNYDKVIAAARAAFAERGDATSLEEIARRAEVGIGTLYRNFPNRQALLEAVYADEVESLCRSSAEFQALAPWDAFEQYVRRLVGYLATKQALAHELLEYVGRDAPLFTTCRGMLFGAGQPLLDRAQEAGVVRSDITLMDILQMFGGIAKIQGAEPEQIDHLVSIALDGLRYRDPA